MNIQALKIQAVNLGKSIAGAALGVALALIMLFFFMLGIASIFVMLIKASN
ncbi:MAG: hypothetical protein PHI49_06670 [Halothiobacillaceae bacterium]|nr:hypothetical protein [Halothiobacillaceae bacterium]